MKNISTDSTPQPNQQGGPGPKKKQFIVIEVPLSTEEPDYPKAIFACDTLEEAVKLCRQMNKDAGQDRYGVQRPAQTSK